MAEQLLAYCVVGWICPVGPALGLWLGIMIGRHGFRRAIYMILLKVFGSEGMTERETQ